MNIQQVKDLYKDLDEKQQTFIFSLIDDVFFIQNQLETLKKLPFIMINPDNPARQRATPAAKQYKELMQQQLNCVKVLLHVGGGDDTGELSPLRDYFNKLRGKD